MPSLAEPKKSLVEAAFGRQPPRYPIWFLRQAGRYLPEYRQIRSGVSFLELCHNPVLAAEVTLQPLQRFDLDAAIIFCDILIPAMAMGQSLTFDQGHGPLLNPPVRTPDEVARLKTEIPASQFDFLAEAIRLTKSRLRADQSMIGFAGAPFTVASYMIEGKGSKTFTQTKKLMYQHPEAFTDLINKLVDVTIGYLTLQVKAGADVLMLFDTWAGQLTCQSYRSYLLPALTRLTQEIKSAFPEVPLIYYPGQGSEHYPHLGELALDVVAIDWRVDMAVAIERLQDLGLPLTVQGNLDPQVLMAEVPTIQAEVDRILRAASQARGHIFNVGHGLLPHIEPEKLNVVIEYIRNQTNS